jgi:hypothetical protein
MERYCKAPTVLRNRVWSGNEFAFISREISGRGHGGGYRFGFKHFSMTQNICNITLLGKKNSRCSGNNLKTKEKFQRTELFYSKVRLEIGEKSVNYLV